MYSRFKLFSIFALVLALTFFLSFLTASAQVTFSTDETAFDLANPGLWVEDFSEAGTAPATVTTCTAPVNSGSNDSCFSPGDILPGLNFVDNPGPEDGGLIMLGANFGGASNPGNVLANNTFNDLHDIEFLGATTVVGLRLGCMTSSGSCGQTIEVSVFGVGNVLLDTTTIAVTDAIDSFLGIVSTSDIRRISLDFTAPVSEQVKAIADIKVNTVALQITNVNEGVCVFTKSVPNKVVIEGATPNGQVALLLSQVPGSFVLSGPVCDGLVLDLGQPRLMTIFTADETGTVDDFAPLPQVGNLSKSYFQVVDISTCTKHVAEPYLMVPDELPNADVDGDGVLNCDDECPLEGPPGPGQGLGDNGCILPIIN